MASATCEQIKRKIFCNYREGRTDGIRKCIQNLYGANTNGLKMRWHTYFQKEREKKHTQNKAHAQCTRNAFIFVWGIPYWYGKKRHKGRKKVRNKKKEKKE